MSDSEKMRLVDSAQSASKFFEISCNLRISIFGHVLFERSFVFPPDKKGGTL